MNFNQIPSSLLVPFVAVELDSSKAAGGPAPLPYRALIIGQKTGAGSAAANSLHLVTSPDDVVALAGRGSMLHRQAIAWFAANKSTEVWIGVLDDSASGVFATGTITITGPATGAGTLSVYIGGEVVQVAVASSDSANTIASALATAIGVAAKGTVTFATAIAGDTITVGGVQFTGAAGAVTPGDPRFSVDTGDNAAAASFAAQVKAHATAGALVHAAANSAVVTLTAVQPGTGGNAITLTSSGATVAVSGATLAGGLTGTNPNLAVHATVASAVVTLHALNAGAAANEIDVRANYQVGEAFPAGVGATIVAMASGATNPTLTTLITAMGDRWFQIIANPFTDATSLSAIEAELASRSGPMRTVPGAAIAAKNDSSVSSQQTLGNSRNSGNSVILDTDASPSWSAEYAAQAAAVIAFYGSIDPARPFQTLPLPTMLAPAEGDRRTLAQRGLLLAAGIATTKVGGSDVVQLERVVTTYHTNAAGSPDTAYRDLNTTLVLIYARWNFAVRMATRYPRHKLGNDGVRYPSGEAVMTPNLGRAEAVSWFLDMSTSSPVVFDPSTLAQFKADLVVERDGSDPNRLNFLLPPDLINMLIVSAAQIQFRL